MTVSYTVSAYFIMILFTQLMSTVRKSKPLPLNLKLLSLNFSHQIVTDPSVVKSATPNYDNIVHNYPAVVLHPSSVQDIANFIKFAYNHSASPPFTVFACGHSHSVHGQATALNGVVIDMIALRNFKQNAGISVSREAKIGFYYADAIGEQLWIDVSKAAMEFRLAPVSYTD